MIGNIKVITSLNESMMEERLGKAIKEIQDAHLEVEIQYHPVMQANGPIRHCALVIARRPNLPGMFI